ncbi:MAG: tetratricopeptide repeat protein [Prevotella sp.]|nr:tetratricopeptide repeat protein [Prevotella sp.]
MMLARIILSFMLGLFSLPGLSQSSQRDYDLLFHEAMLQRQKGHHDSAFDLLSRCRELKPEASEVYFFQAQYFAEMKQQDSAQWCYRRAYELEPENMTYMETLAQACIDQNDYAAATEVVEKMYTADKSRQELLEMLYRLYLQQQDFDKAIEMLERMEAIDGRSERLSLTKSQLYLRLDEKEKAIREVETLANEHPNDVGYQVVYANSLLAADRNDEAYNVLTRILTEEPDNARAQVALRDYYQNEGDSLAVDSLTELLLLNPTAPTDIKIYQLRDLIAESEQTLDGDSTKILHLMDLLMAQKDVDPDIAELRAAYMDLKKMPRDTIAAAFSKVLELAPDRASSRLHLVQMAWDDEDDQRIIDLCQPAREYNPEEMVFYYYQGMAYYRQKDVDNALETFRNGINVINEDSSPLIVSDFYAIMGDLLFQKNREREAFEAYDSCLQWKPDNVGCLNNYAYYLSLQSDRLDEAEQMSYKTIKAEPKNATYLDTYAWILFVQQRYEEARIYIDLAIENDSTGNSVVTEHAGDIHFMTGDTEGALELWQKALADDPSNKILARKIKRKKYIKQ